MDKVWHHFVQKQKWCESGKTHKTFRHPKNDIDNNFEKYTRKHDTASGNPNKKNFNPYQALALN